MADRRRIKDVARHVVANPFVPAALFAETFIAFVNNGQVIEMAAATLATAIVWGISDGISSDEL